MADNVTRLQQAERTESFGAGEGTGKARQADGSPGDRRAADASRYWADFLEPVDNAAFLNGWLGLTALRFATARAAVLFVRGERAQLGVAARWFIEEAELKAAGELADALARAPEPAVRPHIDMTMIGMPIVIDGAVQAVLVLFLDRNPGARLRDMLRRLHWSTGWIEARLWRGRSVVADEQTRTARIILDLLGAADSHERLDGAAIAVVNTLTERTGFDRALVAIVRNGRARLLAISRTASFKRRTEHVLEMEAACDEIVARGEPVALPTADATGGIDLASRLLREKMGAGALVGVPLIVRGEAVGAMIVTRSRADDRQVVLDPRTVDQLSLAGAAVAPVLWLKHRERRWISGRARSLSGRALTAVFGRRPAIALGVWSALAVILGVSLAQGDLRVRADAVLRGSEQRAAIALMDGYVRDAFVRAGDRVTEGQELARLGTRDLELRLTQAETRLRQAEQTRRAALATADRAASARAAAEAAEAGADIDLVRTQLRRAAVLAPVDGLVVSGDLSQTLGTPVTRGDVLFEIAALDAFRVLIDVSEYDVGHVRAGQSGTLVLTGLAGETIPFVVTGISSVSEPRDGQNRFRVEADVTTRSDGLRPGMEGVAKIDIARRNLVWIWMRGTIDRLRLLIWRFTP